MKKFWMIAVASLTLAASPALADTATGVVNIGKIMQASKAATSVRSQLQAKQKAFQADLDAKEKALYAEDQALVKQKDGADKAAFEKKVKDFRAKAATEQRQVQEKKAQLEKSFAGALDEIQKNGHRYCEASRNREKTEPRRVCFASAICRPSTRHYG